MNQPATHSSVSLLLFSQETKPPSHPFTLFPVLFFLTKSSQIYFWGDPRDPAASHSFILFFVLIFPRNKPPPATHSLSSLFFFSNSIKSDVLLGDLSDPASHSLILSLLLFSQEDKPPSYPFTRILVFFVLTKLSQIYFWGTPVIQPASPYKAL